MKILIIGGKGYVGSYLKEELWNSGIYVESYGNRLKDYNDIDTQIKNETTGKLKSKTKKQLYNEILQYV